VAPFAGNRVRPDEHPATHDDSATDRRCRGIAPKDDLRAAPGPSVASESAKQLRVVRHLNLAAERLFEVLLERPADQARGCSRS
jgi:hypothetical protein